MPSSSDESVVPLLAMEAAWSGVLHALLSIIPPEEQIALADHLKGTPRRLARMFADEFLAGYRMDPARLLDTSFDGAAYDEIILVRNITFYSLCAHHFLPFFGRAHVAYLPYALHGVVGLSKLARLVECFARRLQIQERMTAQVAESLMTHTRARGAACVIEAVHLCMGCRGIQRPEAETVTSTLLGDFREDPAARAELMTLIRRT